MIDSGPQHSSDLHGRQVLLVSHEASRTGAPRVALEIARGLRAAGADIEVVLRWSGSLRTEFQAEGLRVRDEPLRHLRASLRRFGARRLARWLEQKMASRVLLRQRPEIVYLNSVLSLSYASVARKLGIAVVAHIHELPPLLDAGLRRWPGVKSVAGSIHWVACSRDARVALCAALNLAPERVRLIRSLVDIEQLHQRAQQRPSISLPPRFVVNCATGDRRKGLDLWLEMVAELAMDPTLEPLEFVWLGRINDPDLTSDYRARPWYKRVHFPGEIANPHAVMRLATAMAFSSRSDVFPLAVVEAMALGIPTVAFDVGGLAEQLPAECRVAPGDTQAMAARVREWLSSETRLRLISRSLSERARTHFDVRAMHRDVAERITEALDAAT